MTSGLNVSGQLFMASMLVGTIGIQWSRWYLAHPKVFTVAAVIPMFPGISAYTAMISAVKSIVRLQRTVDDYPVKQLSYSFIPIVGALSHPVFPFLDYGFCTASALV